MKRRAAAACGSPPRFNLDFVLEHGPQRPLLHSLRRAPPRRLASSGSLHHTRITTTRITASSLPPPGERAVVGSDLTLHVLPEFFEVVRLAPTAPIPADLFASVDPSSIVSITRTSEELSVIRPAGARRIAGETLEEGWRCLKVQGPLPVHLVGVLSHLSATLAAAE